MVKLVGLSGFAQSGKDTAAWGLIADGWERLAFADTLRECLYALNPLVMPGIHLRSFVDSMGWDKAKKHDEVRRLLQSMGTEVGRDILGDSIWIDTTFSKIRDAVGYVITDVRFVNEAEAIQKRDGIVVRIERSGIDAVNGHTSEHSLDGYKFDFIIKNNGTIEELHQLLRTVLEARK